MSTALNTVELTYFILYLVPCILFYSIPFHFILQRILLYNVFYLS
jgi:hypothetical protein